MLKALLSMLFGGSKKKSLDPAEQQKQKAYQLRTDLEKGIKAKLIAQKKDAKAAGEIAELVVNYIFDFGEFGFEMSTGKDIKKVVGAELLKVCEYQLVDPIQLCVALTQRALANKKTGEVFESHLRDLWILCLVPIGPFTPPDSAFPTSQQQLLAKRIREIAITPKQVENCIKAWPGHMLVPHMQKWHEATLAAQAEGH
ncbi:hypothetical protein GH816_06070 [Betaproteobacteria bacterium LSUCC0115]|nr:hypothetical protein [Burkholderiales bacterium LSUCC0115]